MAKTAVRPEALAAGAVVMFGMALLYNRASNRCVEFHDLWQKDGPIHLQQHIQDQAFDHAAMKLRSADAAGRILTVFQVRDYLLEHFEPKCNWDSMRSERGKVIMESFTDIERYAVQKFYGVAG